MEELNHSQHTEIPQPDHLGNAVQRMEDAVAAMRAAYIFADDSLLTELLEGCCAEANALYFKIKRYNALARHR